MGLALTTDTDDEKEKNRERSHLWGSPIARGVSWVSLPHEACRAVTSGPSKSQSCVPHVHEHASPGSWAPHGKGKPRLKTNLSSPFHSLKHPGGALPCTVGHTLSRPRGPREGLPCPACRLSQCNLCLHTQHSPEPPSEAAGGSRTPPQPSLSQLLLRPDVPGPATWRKTFL